MKLLQGLKTGILKLVKMLISVAMWLAITIGLFIGFIALNKEHYQPDDIPNPKFQIAVVTADNRTKPIYWQDLNNQTIVTTSDESCAKKHCLLQKDDSFIYHSEGAMWTSESEYNIVNGKAQPISYSFYSLNEALSAFILSFAVYAVLKYTILRLWYRQSAEKIQALNQANLNGLKNWGIFIVIAIMCCIGLILL